ncbi:hypothetical protein M9Y10_017086 [Tritrichomonas musculus]|uniref:Nucleotide-diphospho-sugar transferase domain-containing protein n=1 Tax=Tritrichomonas musculus TaxID=1915356 RepID=A0ABR2HV45_9EUKA
MQNFQLFFCYHKKTFSLFWLFFLYSFLQLSFFILKFLVISKDPNIIFATFKVNHKFYMLERFKTSVSSFIKEFNASDFFNNDFFQEINLLNTKPDFSNCPLCSIVKKKSNSSSKRDLIFSYAYGNRTKGFVSFVRSIRSTGCKATIVFMYEDPFLFSFSSNERLILKNCGSFFINAGKINRKKFNIMSIRYAFFLEFLEIYKKCFDRVIMTDAADTYVQLDPFDIFPEKGFWSSTEGNYFWKYKWHSARVFLSETPCNISFYNNTRTLCAGLVWGNVKDTIKFLRFFVNVSYWKKNNRVNDQGLLNILYYRRNISFHADFTGKYMISASDFIWEKKYDQNFLFKTIYGTTPSIIHQYDRICVIYSNVEFLCPKAPGQLTGFDINYRFKSDKC